LAAEIGLVCAYWSRLEWELQDTVRLLLAADDRRGRIATNGMNVRSRLLCVESLMVANQMPDSLVKEFRKFADVITNKREAERNKIVHSLWHKDATTGDFRIIITSGSWTPPGGEKIRRSVRPESERMNAADARAIRDRISGLAWEMRKLRDKMVAVLTSQRK